MQLALTTKLRPVFTWQWVRSHKTLSAGVVFLALYVAFELPSLIYSFAAGKPYKGNSGGFLFFAAVFLGWLAAKWVIRTILWRLRNRLMVTYIFIGVIPIFLIALMVAIAALLFSGQYAAQRMHARVDAAASKLELVTGMTGARLAEAMKSGRAPTVTDATAEIRSEFPAAEVGAWVGGTPLRGTDTGKVKQPPEWTKGKFGGFVYDGGKLYMRAVNASGTGKQRVVLYSSVLLDEPTVSKLMEGLGTVDIKLFHGLDILSDHDPDRKPVVAITTPKDREDQKKVTESMLQPLLKAGKIPDKHFTWDPEYNFNTVMIATDWATGERLAVNDDNGRRSTIIIGVATRPSAIYNELFYEMGQVSYGAVKALTIIAIVFATIEVFALIIAFGLTRSITRAVAKLYRGTQRVNRGDLSCCIEVKSNDQLAELEKSFNSMTQSLVALIAEQKEKQRLESELAIAQEVQAQLFPKQTQRVRGLDLHGLCLPARTVSGDYYDFVPLDDENLLIAVGDISGKGISAALLMATLHSAVRSYDLRRLALPAASMSVAGVSSVSGISIVPAGTGEPAANGPGPQCCVADFMQSLNTQLFKSTPPAKYATLFLGCFHALTGTFTYSNGGHLAPILVSPDGRVRRLEAGGMVVGLMDGMTYDQATVEFGVGDLLVTFTDGITEPEDANGNDFGEDRLVELVRANRSRELPELAQIITDEVKRFIGDAEQPDDMTVVLARAR